MPLQNSFTYTANVKSPGLFCKLELFAFLDFYSFLAFCCQWYFWWITTCEKSLSRVLFVFDHFFYSSAICILQSMSFTVNRNYYIFTQPKSSYPQYWKRAAVYSVYRTLNTPKYPQLSATFGSLDSNIVHTLITLEQCSEWNGRLTAI